MNQESLFAEQEEQLDRVRSKIAPVILRYFQDKPTGFEFHMADLEAYVRSASGGAPDSPSRILRALRQAGYLQYEVVSRAKSLYRLLGMA